MSTRSGSSWRDKALVPLSTLGYWLAVGSLRPFVPLRLADGGASETVIGLVVALSPLSATLFALPAGRLMDRLGARTMALWGLAVMAVAGVGYAWAPTVAMLAVLQVAAGIGELIVWIALAVLVTDGVASPGSTRIALFSLAWGLGATVGPVVGGFLFDATGFVGLSIFYIVTTLSAACIAWVRSAGNPKRANDAKPESMIRAVLRLLREPEVRAVLAVSFIMQAIVGLRQSYYPVYLESAGVPVPVIGILLTVLAGASLAARPVAPFLARRHSPMRLLFLSVWLSIIGVALTPGAPMLVVLVTGAALMGVGLGMNTVLTVEEMARTTRPEERGMAMGTRVLANRLAHMTQPVAFGAVLSVLTMGPTFIVTVGVLSALTLAAHRDSRHHHRPG